jgi:protein PhnA
MGEKRPAAVERGSRVNGHDCHAYERTGQFDFLTFDLIFSYRCRTGRRAARNAPARQPGKGAFELPRAFGASKLARAADRRIGRNKITVSSPKNHRFAERECGMTIVVRDSNGAQLKDGDSVTLIKDLKVKGSSIVLKRGAMIKNIRLTDDPAEIECRAEKVKDLVLRTEFVKKA